MCVGGVGQPFQQVAHRGQRRRELGRHHHSCGGPYRPGSHHGRNPLTDGKGENAVASAIRKALKEKLGKGFKVEVDDGEDVLVKQRGSTPNFDLTLVESTVKGVRLNLQHE